MNRRATHHNEDRWAIPLRRAHHTGQRDSARGHGNAGARLAAKGINGRALARTLWSNRTDPDAMERAVFRPLQSSTLRNAGAR